MSNRLIKNALSVAGQTISLAIVWLILYRYLFDTIGIEKLGVWSIVLATTSASRLSEMGFTASVTKFIATYRSENNEQSAVEALQTAAISLGIIVSVILLFAYPLLQLAMPHLLPKDGLSDGLEILPYALISIWFSVVSGIWMSGLDGCLRSDIRAGLMIASNVLLLVMAFILVKPYGLAGLAIAQIAQGIALFIFGWIAIKKVMPSLPFLPIQWKKNQFRAMLDYGVNFQINSIVMMLFDPITKVLLGRFGDLSTVGYFEMAQRIVMMVRSLVIASNQVIIPVFAGLRAENINEANNLYTRNMQYLLLLITPIFSALIAIMPVISEIWLGSYQNQFMIMAIYLSSAWYFNSINAPAYFAYLGSGKLRWVTVGFTIMGFTNISVGIILGLSYGWQGVIMAYIIALSLGSEIITYMYHKENKLSIIRILSSNDIKFIVMCFSSSVVALACYWYMIELNISKVTRILSTIIFTSTISLVIIWTHPMRKEVYLRLKNL